LKSTDNDKRGQVSHVEIREQIPLRLPRQFIAQIGLLGS
jgi:hypothetical protein